MRTLIATATVSACAAALASFVWVTNEYADEVAALRLTASTQVKTIEGLNKDVATLRQSIADNNHRIDEERKAFEEAKKKADAAIAELEKTNKARWARIKELEGLVIPPVDISGMTTEQIVEEITDCRQAIEINNGF